MATPIGHLDDLTARARETLRTVDLIVCEDTRVTRKLLDRYAIERPTLSFHQHSGPGRIDDILTRIRAGQRVALVTDAGTPGVSDPGGLLVAAAYDAGVPVLAVPGPSAVTAALSVSGLPTDRFTCYGFLPHKKGRETRLAEIERSSVTSVFFESPHRIMKTLSWFRDRLTDERMVVVGRELTKQFEEVVRGSPRYVFGVFSDHPGKLRGEFVVVVSPAA